MFTVSICYMIFVFFFVIFRKNEKYIKCKSSDYSTLLQNLRYYGPKLKKKRKDKNMNYNNYIFTFAVWCMIFSFHGKYT